MSPAFRSSKYVFEASSEEEPEIVKTNADGQYVLCWDPLDGSSIVDAWQHSWNHAFVHRPSKPKSLSSRQSRGALGRAQDNNWAVGTIVGVWDKSTGLIGATGRDQAWKRQGLGGHGPWFELTVAHCLAILPDVWHFVPSSCRHEAEMYHLGQTYWETPVLGRASGGAGWGGVQRAAAMVWANCNEPTWVIKTSSPLMKVLYEKMSFGSFTGCSNLCRIDDRVCAMALVQVMSLVALYGPRTTAPRLLMGHAMGR